MPRTWESSRSVWALPLALLAAAVVLFLVRDVPDTIALVLASSVAVIALVGALQSVASGLRPVAAAFYIFTFAWLGVGPIMQMSIRRVAWGDLTILSDTGAMRHALALTALAAAAFWVGNRLGQRNERTRRRPPTHSTVRTPIQWLLSVALIVVGANAIRVLGMSNYFVARTERAEALNNAGIGSASVGGVEYALYTVLPSSLAIAVLLLAIIGLKSTRWQGRSVGISQWFHLALGLAGCAFFANPVSQTRFIAVIAIGGAALQLFEWRSRFSGYLFLAGGLVGTLLVYPLANAFRYAGSSLGDVTQDTFAGADFDGFQQVVNTLRFVETHGYTWGNELLSSALFFVPRSFWEWKAIPASVRVAEDAGYTFTNLSLPLHAELYLQFGLIGLALGMLWLGWISGRLDSEWLTHPRSKWALLAPVAAFSMFGLLRGPLGAQVPAFAAIIIFLVLALRSNSSAAEVTGSSSTNRRQRVPQPSRSPSSAALRGGRTTR
ncbi:hypothetical protein [Microbacterium sp.]|uniref:hypothetical protein n=1 Tax=Microbacterium sp. TaxID=51671 RepID=UPI003C786574